MARTQYPGHLGGGGAVVGLSVVVVRGGGGSVVFGSLIQHDPSEGHTASSSMWSQSNTNKPLIQSPLHLWPVSLCFGGGTVVRAVEGFFV